MGHFVCFVLGPVADSCEHGMNLRFSNKSGDCFDYMSGYLGSEQLWSIK